MIAAILISFPLATVAAVRRGGWIDRLALLFSLLGLSLPNFWLGPLLMIVFSHSTRLAAGFRPRQSEPLVLAGPHARFRHGGDPDRASCARACCR